MMRKILPLFLVLILSFTFVGCGGEGETLTPEQIDQLVANVTSAQEDIETYQFDVDMGMTMGVTGGTAEGEITMDASGDGAMSLVDQRMKMLMTMTMDIPGMGEETMEQESYLVGGWMYVRQSLAGMDLGWMKMEMPEETWETQNQLDQQIEFLTGGNLSLVKFLGSEKVSGVDCYVLEVTPDMVDLANYLSQQQGMEDLTALDLTQLIIAIKQFSIKEWLAKDSGLCMKASDRIYMEMTPELLNVSPEEFEKMAMDMDIAITFRDYNKPVSIVLPPEALNAQEITSGY